MFVNKHVREQNLYLNGKGERGGLEKLFNAGADALSKEKEVRYLSRRQVRHAQCPSPRDHQDICRIDLFNMFFRPFSRDARPGAMGLRLTNLRETF